MRNVGFKHGKFYLNHMKVARTVQVDDDELNVMYNCQVPVAHIRDVDPPFEKKNS